MTRHLLLLLATFTMVTAACGGAADDPGATTPLSDLDGTSWVLADAVDGAPTLDVDGLEIGGTDGCNGYGGRLELDGDRVSVVEVNATLIGCPDHAHADYLATLQAVTTVSFDGEQLVLEGPDAALRFDPAGAEAKNDGVDGDWVLVEGVDVPNGSRVTMSVDGTTVGGTAACNSWGGEVTRDGDGFRVGQVGQTEMGCEPAVMTAEADFLAAIQGADEATVEDGRLRVRGTGPDLVFERLAPVPTAAVVGTVWVLDGLVTGPGPDGAVSSVAGEPARLVLVEDGTLRASTGCRDFLGDWIENGDEILFPSFGQAPNSADECPPELVDQENHVLSVLGDGFRAAVDGQRLTLVDGDLGLVYRTDAG